MTSPHTSNAHAPSADEVAAACADDYFEARDKFLAAARSAGAQVETLPCPGVGPAGEPLSMDTARLGEPGADKLLVVISGVHGVEGYAGSAIQVDALRRLRPAPGQAVLCIHAANPYGMAWTSVETEGGVDLNRNFVDFDGPLPHNPLYDELDDVFMCPEVSGPLREAAELKARQYVERHGLSQYLHAGADGQYHRPGRFNFAGREPAWSNTAVRAVIAEAARGVADLALVDVHTGFGDRGAGVMLAIRQTPEANARARAWWGDTIQIPSADFPWTPQGTLVAAAPQMAPEARVTAAALEFGTEPIERVGQSMVDRFRLATFSSLDAPEAAGTLAEIKACLAPSDTPWRRAVLNRGRQVLDQALAGLAGA
ncbi:DUF2817 domain-containing protein [Caulobacter sp. CCUG 60055]|uniref:DUF2817 domain-containing protein n=1 Tax=Caulobacter sp. CCUG 60055 TaxID=2100090 RepID=UPI001FA7D8E3|nr:DUF2817 domain-containing protein [Caulobacter sp. CCUG 60055]MCI3182103.1 DUF2817 domain-containing protein [Caulobacter sp. CCUG 60055]